MSDDNCVSQLKLVKAPAPEYNFFFETMLSSSRVMMIKQKIIDHHGRVENIQLYDKDPTIYKKEAEEKARLKAEKEAENKKKEKDGEEPAEAVEEVEEPPAYRTFENSSATLFDIFGQYGVEMKKELEENETDEAKASRGTLYYDFTPYRANDPVLLSLMRSKVEDAN